MLIWNGRRLYRASKNRRNCKTNEQWRDNLRVRTTPKGP